MKNNIAGKQDLNINHAQVGIAPFPEQARFLTIYLKDQHRACYGQWLALSKLVRKYCTDSGDQLACVCGVDFGLWQDWSEENDWPLPAGLIGHESIDRKPFASTRGDLWFHIKGRKKQECTALSNKIVRALDAITERYITTQAYQKDGGKVFGGRFQDAMINPVDQVNLSERSLVGKEDEFYRGSAYVIQQKFKHNWKQLDDMNEIEMEDMIGRNHDNAMIPMHDERSHVKRVRQLDGKRVTLRLLRQAVTYGQADGNKAKEEGVYFVAYTDSGAVYEELTSNIVGAEEGFIKDKMLSNSHAVSGNYWFVPAARFLDQDGPKGAVDVPLNHYYNIRSDNGLMHYNNRAFLHNAQREGSELSDRILILLGQTFSRWNDTWAKNDKMPRLGFLQDYLEEPAWKKYRKVGNSKSAALRKGLAIKVSLSDVLQRESFRKQAGLMDIKPHEIIVGNLPPLTLGSGSQVMEYLNENEKIEAFFGMLNEYSATGHNVPKYKKVLRLGVGGLLNEANKRLKTSSGSAREFYQSTVWALEGLQEFILSYADLAATLAEETATADKEVKANYSAIAKRMKKLASVKPGNMLEAAQLIFIINCSLHQTGEPMSIGRLDQYLIDFYKADLKAKRLTEAGAQEIIDAFWLKMDQTVLYNRQHMNDYLTYGTGAVFYSAGNFPQGSALNQWVQQVTIGGYLPEGSKEGKDGCNEVTLLCLRASRRLPLNAPCLSLRVHKNMNKPIHRKIMDEAAKSILSGGAHPILINDDKLVKGLAQSGPLKLADARDYVCDGCYEPIIQGKSEWVFSYVPILPAVGMAMNQGSTIAGAGWVHLRGMKTGWNSPPPEEINSFEEFLEIFFTHYRWLINSFLNTLMSSYGALANVCPSPLFSSMVDGCMESGKDLTDGGAEYHIAAPMLCGITDAINALYAIKKMVYDPKMAVTTLPELLEALWNDWGEGMQEPFQNEFAGPERAQNNAVRYKELRSHALSLPKFGLGGNAELKNLANEVVGECVQMIRASIDDPIPSVKKGYEALKKKYKQKNKTFAFVLTPGVGTFEDNIGLGVGMGASADGRLSGDPIADDFCPAPSPKDRPPQTEPHDIFTSLDNWNLQPINEGLSNAAPVDINIREDYPLADMVKLIKTFSQGKTGSNLLTITTANPETYSQSQVFPEKYDLVRVRQGGWSEFYIAMFPDHQSYIARRPYFAPKN